MSKLRGWAALLAVAFTVSTLPAWAGSPKGVNWRIEGGDSIEGAAGTVVQIKIVGVVPDGWHTYSTKEVPAGGAASATTIKLNPAEALSISGAITSDPKPTPHTQEGVEVEWWEKTVTLTVPVKISADAKPGEIKDASININSTICNDKVCKPPFDVKLDLKVIVKTSAAPPPPHALPRDLSMILPGSSALKTAKPKMTWKIESAEITGARGEIVPIKITAVVPEGHYSYGPKVLPDGVIGYPTAITAGPEKLLVLADAVTVAPFVAGEKFEKLVGAVTFTVPVQIHPDAQPGSHAGELGISAQFCTNPGSEKEVCIRSMETLDVKVKISDAPPVATTVAAKPIDKTASNAKKKEEGSGGILSMSVAEMENPATIANAKKQGLMAYIWLSMGAGALALLTPCVFPMIPITVSFFTKRKEATRAKSVRDAGIYAMGIILSFTLIGFACALFLGATGVSDFAANPWTNLVVAAIFIGLALNLFGMFELSLPSGILNKLNNASSQHDGIASVLLMGVVFSLTSFTCTVPFIGGVMVAASQGEWMWPAMGMLAFSTVFAIPFFLLAIFPAWLKSLPKSGGWMNSVKVVMGFIELAAALKFISAADSVWAGSTAGGVFTRELFLAIWVALCLLATYYLLGHIRFPHDSAVEKVGGIRILFATFFLSLAIFLGSGMFGRPLGGFDAFAPTAIAMHGGGGASNELSWHEDWDEALADAKKTGKPVFVDYTGFTCTNCRKMETGVFPHPSVSAELKNFVRVRLYTDYKDNAANIERSKLYRKMQEERYDNTALPFYAVVTPEGKDVHHYADGYDPDAEKFARFLKEARTKAMAVMATLPAGTAETAQAR